MFNFYHQNFENPEITKKKYISEIFVWAVFNNFSEIKNYIY